MSDHDPVPVTTMVEPEAINTYAIVRAEQLRLRGQEVTPCDRVPRGTHYPAQPPAFAHEDDAAYTDRLTGRHGNSPYDHRRFRHCAIGYHLSCSDKTGYECQCPCHLDRQPDAGFTATEKDRTLALCWVLPLRTAQAVLTAVNMAVRNNGDTIFGTPVRVVTDFEGVRDVIANARPYYSRPGVGFTLDVVNILGVADRLTGVPEKK